jgi:hypothetical protein
MNYFVNILEITDGAAGEYRTYRLYSGESPEKVKFNLVNDLKDSWIDVSDEIDNLENPNDMDFGEIGDFFTAAIEEDGYISDYHIEISKPYTDVMEAFRFYRNYENDKEEFLDAEVGFYFYIEDKLKDTFPLLSSLANGYNVRISSNIVDRIYDMLK